MLLLNLTKDALKFLQGIERKHAGQLALKIFALMHELDTSDVKGLKGSLATYLRADCGEYRIIYRVIDNHELQIILIGKRNDDEVYKSLRRK